MATVRVECRRSFLLRGEPYYETEVIEVSREDAEMLESKLWVRLTTKPLYRISVPESTGTTLPTQVPTDTQGLTKLLEDVGELSKEITARKAEAEKAAKEAAASAEAAKTAASKLDDATAAAETASSEATKATKAAEAVTQKSNEIAQTADQVSLNAAAVLKAVEDAKIEAARLEALARSLQVPAGNVGVSDDHDF